MFPPLAFSKKAAVALLFSLSLLFFVNRGPYRALRDARTGDFATIYAAARCWLHHENPYDRSDLRQELIESGAPPSLIREQDRHASLYLPPGMPFVAVFAWLPWTVANVTWCLLSLGCFAASLYALLHHLRLSNTAKWTAASICLFFSPTYVGVLNGNPSVFSIGLAILSLHFAMQNRSRIAALLFAVTLCVKPQIALCSLLALLLWKCWATLWLGSALAAIVSALATLQASSFGRNWQWWASLRDNLAKESSPGGLVDPRPSSPYVSQLINWQTLSYLLTPNARIAEGMVLLLSLSLAALYFYRRTKNHAPPSWLDAAFFAGVTLGAAYHRYYDAQLLLVLIPAAVCLWQRDRVRTAYALGVCFTLLAFPLQSILGNALGPAATQPSFAPLILLRLQPIAILAATLLLSLQRRLTPPPGVII